MPDSLFTFIAQLVNFIIIVIVLRFLLFDRIVSAVNKRQKDISERGENARRHEDEARKREEELEKETADFKRKREKMLSDAEKDAERRKQEIIRQARKETEDKREQWKRQLERESDSFIAGLKNSAAEDLINLSSRMFSDLADSEVQDRMAYKLLDVLKNENSGFNDRDEGEKVSVESSFKIPEELRVEFGNHFENIEFNENNDIHGIRLQAGGRRLEWTIESWLSGFGDKLKDRISGV